MLLPRQPQAVVVIRARRSNNCVLEILLLFISKNSSATKAMLPPFIITSLIGKIRFFSIVCEFVFKNYNGQVMLQYMYIHIS